MPEEAITLTTVLAGAGSGILVPFVNKLLGPAADEVGMMMGDRVRLWRLERQIDLFARTQKMLKDKGIEPKQVGMKTLLPLMENASLEDDPQLSDKWVALLANAADGSSSIEIKPAFVEILKQLHSSEALLLDDLFKKADSRWHTHPFKNPDFRTMSNRRRQVVERLFDLRNIKAYQSSGQTDPYETDTIVDNLLRNRLLNLEVRDIKDSDGILVHATRKNIQQLSITSLGFDFVIACTPPSSPAA